MAPDVSKGKLKKIKKQQANAAERARKATLKEAAKARDLLSKVRKARTPATAADRGFDTPRNRAQLTKPTVDRPEHKHPRLAIL